MERTPPIQPPNANPAGPSRPEAGGSFFERWRKKAKKAEAAPTIATPETPKLQPEQTRREKFAKNMANFLFGKPPENNQPHPPTGPEQTPATPEVPIAPLVERASRMRRLARAVINQVLGVAEAEHLNVKKWDGANASPLNTEPLVAAAGDLRGAAQGLPHVMPEAPAGYAGAAQPTSSEISVVSRITERMRDVEEKLQTQTERAEKSEVRLAAVRTGLGIVAILGVVLVGHEYLAHKKIRKDQKTLREIQAEQQAEIILQKQNLEAMTRREREAHYERLSQLTHRQADATREVARDLQQEALVMKVAHGDPGQVPAVRGSEWQPVVNRTAPPENILSTPEQRLAPLLKVEAADVVEHAPSQSGGRSTSPQIGGVAAGGRVLPGDDGILRAANVPLSPAAQRELAARQARAQRLASNAWLYGVGLVVSLVAVAWLVLSLV